MNVGFEDGRGKLIWTLPPEAAELLSKAPPEKQGQAVDILQKCLGIVALFSLRSLLGDQRLAQHLEALMNVMTDLMNLPNETGEG